MTFDIRLPIGLLFLAIGALLAIAGLTFDPASLNSAILGVNIDLAWGAAMLLFGAVMTGLALTARKS